MNPEGEASMSRRLLAATVLIACAAGTLLLLRTVPQGLPLPDRGQAPRPAVRSDRDYFGVIRVDEDANDIDAREGYMRLLEQPDR
jgi:hypothetical protein